MKSVYVGNVIGNAANQPPDLRWSSEPGIDNHHRCNEINSNTEYGEDNEYTIEDGVQSNVTSHKIPVYSRSYNEY